MHVPGVLKKPGWTQTEFGSCITCRLCFKLLISWSDSQLLGRIGIFYAPQHSKWIVNSLTDSEELNCFEGCHLLLNKDQTTWGAWEEGHFFKEFKRKRHLFRKWFVNPGWQVRVVKNKCLLSLRSFGDLVWNYQKALPDFTWPSAIDLVNSVEQLLYMLNRQPSEVGSFVGWELVGETFSQLHL